MKQLFVETTRKIKRIDFLLGFIKRKNEEKAKRVAEAAVLRKKNGRAPKSDFELALFQLNARISEISDSIEKSKAEVKSLKTSTSEALRKCYAAADDLDFLKRVESAYDHVFEGKSSLVSLGEVGGLFGDCKIVGAVTTSEKSKKCSIKEVVSAGERTKGGRLVAEPEVVVWDYDPTKPEGEFRVEDDSFKAVLKKRKTPKIVVFLKETYGLTLVSASILIASAILVALEFFRAFGLSEFVDLTSRRALAVFAVGFVGIAARSAIGCVKEKRGAFPDGAALVAFILAVAEAIGFAVDGKARNVAAAIILAAFALVVFFVRFVFSKSEGRTADNSATAFFIGVWTSLVFGLICESVDASDGFILWGIIGAILASEVVGFVGVRVAPDFENKRRFKEIEKASIAFFACALASKNLSTAAFVCLAVAAALSIAELIFRRLKDDEV